MTATRLNPQPVVEVVELGSKNLAANATDYLSLAAPVKQGYRFAGVCGGYWSHPASVFCGFFANGTTIIAGLHNFGGSATTESVRANALYLPD